MKKAFLIGLALCFIVCIPFAAKAWDTGLTIYNFSSETIWLTFNYETGCSKASKSYPSALAPGDWKDQIWSFDAGCKLKKVTVRKSNASGTVLGTCDFTVCSSSQCPGTYVNVQYNTQLTNPTYCMTSCRTASWYDTGCWN
jgi:hypothetical protein